MPTAQPGAVPAAALASAAGLEDAPGAGLGDQKAAGPQPGDSPSPAHGAVSGGDISPLTWDIGKAPSMAKPRCNQPGSSLLVPTQHLKGQRHSGGWPWPQGSLLL